MVSYLFVFDEKFTNDESTLQSSVGYLAKAFGVMFHGIYKMDHSASALANA